MRRPVVAVNTLSISEANEGIRTMMVKLVPALVEHAPDLDLLLVCSAINRHLFPSVEDRQVVEVPLGAGKVLRRILHEQLTVPRVAARRADALVTPSSVGALRCRVPQVVVVAAHLAVPSIRALAHGHTLGPLHRLYYGPLLRASLSRATRVLGISEHLTAALVGELGVEPAKAATLRLGVAPPGPVRLDGREPLALFVSTLYPYKEAHVALDAFVTALPLLPDDARLCIVGRDPDGSTIPRLRARARAAGSADRIEVAGPVSDDELAALYRRASVLLMPSRCEGFGLPVLEAMANGVAVVASAATSIPEVAGDAAVLVRPGDVTGFADGLARLLIDDPLRRRHAQHGLDRAAELSWEASARTLRSIVEEALACAPR